MQMNELIRQIQHAQNEQEFRHIIGDAVAYNVGTSGYDTNKISCRGNTIQPLLDATSAAVARFGAQGAENETPQEAASRREFTLARVGDFLSLLPTKITDAGYDVKSHIRAHLFQTKLGGQLSELAGRDVHGLRRGFDARENIETAKRACQNLRIRVSSPINFQFFIPQTSSVSESNGALNQRSDTRNERQLKEWGFEENQLDSALENIYRTILCPISLQVMDDPIKISSQKVYDRSSLTTYLETASLDNEGMASCPLTRQPFQPAEVDNNPTDNEMLKLIQSVMGPIRQMRNDSSIQMKR